MTIEMIRQELALFWQKLCYFFNLFLDFARQVVKDPTMVSRGDLIMMGATLLIVVLFLLGGLRLLRRHFYHVGRGHRGHLLSGQHVGLRREACDYLAGLYDIVECGRGGLGRVLM